MSHHTPHWLVMHRQHSAQRWPTAAEATTPAAAEVAVRELIAFASKTYGAVESNGLATGAAVTAKGLMAVAETKGKAQLKPKREPADAFVFASIFKDPTHGWFAFFYVQSPRTAAAPR